MNPRLAIAISSILKAEAAVDLDADPEVNNAKFNEYLAPAIDDMRETGEDIYFVTASTSIIRELMEMIARETGQSKPQIASYLLREVFAS